MRKFNKKSAITFIAALFMSAIGTPHAARATTSTITCVHQDQIKEGRIYACGDGTCCAPSGAQCLTYCPDVMDPPEVTVVISVEDAGKSSVYTCIDEVYKNEYTCPDDGTVASDGMEPQNCDEKEYFCYWSRTSGTVYQKRRTYSCTTCPTGYKLVKATKTNSQLDCKITYGTCEKIACYNTECADITTWTDVSGSEGMQMQCNTSTDKCEYKCKYAYYDSSYVFHESPSEAKPSCKKCPSGALCNNNKISCNIGYYLTRTGGLSGGVIMGNYTYSCNQCPAVSNNVGDTIYGTTSARIYNDNEVFDDVKVKSSVTLCYIPPDVHITTKEGHEYRFKSNCNYSPGSGVVIVPGN